MIQMLTNPDKMHNLLAQYRLAFGAWSDHAARLHNIRVSGSDAAIADQQCRTDIAEAKYKLSRDLLTEEMLVEHRRNELS